MVFNVAGVIALAVGALFTVLSMAGVASSSGAIVDLVALCASLLLMLLGVGFLILAVVMSWSDGHE